MPSNALGEITKVWTNGSSSNPNKKYETIQYADGSTSCDCPGWTRRVAGDGSRCCKHTRAVDMGVADSQAEAVKDYQAKAPKAKAAKVRIVVEEGTQVEVARRIRM